MRMAPDRGWIPFIKVLFGFAILLVLAVLAALIALGSVKAESSFGLNIILGGLLTLSGGFASWAFRGSMGKDETEDIHSENPK